MRKIVKLFPKVGGELIINDIAHSLSINIELDDGDEPATPSQDHVDLVFENALAQAAYITSNADAILRDAGYKAHWNERVIAVNAPAPRDDTPPQQTGSPAEPPAQPKGSQPPASAGEAVAYAVKKIQAQNGNIGVAFVDSDGEDIHDPALKMFNTTYNAKLVKKLAGLTGQTFDLTSDKGVGLVRELSKPVIVVFKQKDNGYCDVKDLKPKA
jgi:hypothetical protein